MKSGEKREEEVHVKEQEKLAPNDLFLFFFIRNFQKK